MRNRPEACDHFTVGQTAVHAKPIKGTPSCRQPARRPSFGTGLYERAAGCDYSQYGVQPVGRLGFSGLTVAELWISYLVLGGAASQAQVEAWASGQVRPESDEHNLIVQAINERFIDLGGNQPVGYREIAPLR
jgi:hypothetical protein